MRPYAGVVPLPHNSIYCASPIIAEKSPLYKRGLCLYMRCGVLKILHRFLFASMGKPNGGRERPTPKGSAHRDK